MTEPIAKTRLDHLHSIVSTVRLNEMHRKLLPAEQYETMVFGLPGLLPQWRSATQSEAASIHDRVVASLCRHDLAPESIGSIGVSGAIEVGNKCV